MTTLFKTVLREIGPEAFELIDKGVLILFEVGAPPELAEVSVLHEKTVTAGRPPTSGDRLRIGSEEFAITAVGPSAWQKIVDIGHVVFSFTGTTGADRPGEICVQTATPETLQRILTPGAELEVLGRD